MRRRDERAVVQQEHATFRTHTEVVFELASYGRRKVSVNVFGDELLDTRDH
jgi:hypothetical protein